MPVKSKTRSSSFSWKLPVGLLVIGAVGYYFAGGSDSSTTKETAAAKKAPTTGPASEFTPADYAASFQILKINPKDAFAPLIHKELIVADNDKGGLPGYITGGGDWTYDGMVTVDGKVQALMDEQKSGQSDYLVLGQHWKHGKVKRISDSEIVFDGDNGTPATLKMGDSSAVASKTVNPASSANAPVAVQPPALDGSIGTLDITPLPPAGGFGRGFNGRGRGRGRGGRGNWNGF